MTSIDTENFIKENLSKKLMADEKLLWFGYTEKNATPHERGKHIGEVIFAVVGIILLTLGLFGRLPSPELPEGVAIVGTEESKPFIQEIFESFMSFLLPILLYAGLILTIVDYLHVRMKYYVITDRHLYVMNKNGKVIDKRRLREYRRVDYFESSRRIGYVRLCESAVVTKGDHKYYLRGIGDCYNAYESAKQAVEAIKRSYVINID